MNPSTPPTRGPKLTGTFPEFFTPLYVHTRTRLNDVACVRRRVISKEKKGVVFLEGLAVHGETNLPSDREFRSRVLVRVLDFIVLVNRPGKRSSFERSHLRGPATCKLDVEYSSSFFFLFFFSSSAFSLHLDFPFFFAGVRYTAMAAERLAAPLDSDNQGLRIFNAGGIYSVNKPGEIRVQVFPTLAWTRV